jgi:uncharacterized protein YjiS (DUF1127 family)
MPLYVLHRGGPFRKAAGLRSPAARPARAEGDTPNRARWIRADLAADADGRRETICIHKAHDPAAPQENADTTGILKICRRRVLSHIFDVAATFQSIARRRVPLHVASLDDRTLRDIGLARGAVGAPLVQNWHRDPRGL